MFIATQNKVQIKRISTHMDTARAVYPLPSLSQVKLTVKYSVDSRLQLVLYL